MRHAPAGEYTLARRAIASLDSPNFQLAEQPLPSKLRQDAAQAGQDNSLAAETREIHNSRIAQGESGGLPVPRRKRHVTQVPQRLLQIGVVRLPVARVEQLEEMCSVSRCQAAGGHRPELELSNVAAADQHCPPLELASDRETLRVLLAAARLPAPVSQRTDT